MPIQIPITASPSGADSSVTVGDPNVTPPAGGRPYFPQADWLWKAIPASPVLHSNSSTWAGYFSQGGHPLNITRYGLSIVHPDQVMPSTPRYDVPFSRTGSWGPDPFGSDRVPIPLGTKVPSGSDGHLSVVDPTNTNGNSYSYDMWQARFANSSWSATWGGKNLLSGDGRDSGGSTAAALPYYAFVAKIGEVQAAAAAGTGIGHALGFSTDILAPSSFVFPAKKTDGQNPAHVAVPIPIGSRVQLNPSVNVDALNITIGEKVLCKTLQTHGAYVTDSGGARMAFGLEYPPESTGVDDCGRWEALGITADWWALRAPWNQVRVLRNWDGSA